jgi:hypothetical protein
MQKRYRNKGLVDPVAVYRVAPMSVLNDYMPSAQQLYEARHIERTNRLVFQGYGR